MFALPAEELRREKLKFEEPQNYNPQMFQSSMRSDRSDEEFQRASVQNMDFNAGRDSKSQLTKKNISVNFHYF